MNSTLLLRAGELFHKRIAGPVLDMNMVKNLHVMEYPNHTTSSVISSSHSIIPKIKNDGNKVNGKHYLQQLFHNLEC